MDEDQTIDVTLSQEHLDLLALAMDRLTCDMDAESPLAPFALSLFMFFDELAEQAYEASLEPEDRIVARQDNLIVVDFGSKED